MCSEHSRRHIALRGGLRHGRDDGGHRAAEARGGSRHGGPRGGGAPEREDDRHGGELRGCTEVAEIVRHYFA